MGEILVYGMTNNPGGIESYLLNCLELVGDEGINFDFVTDFSSVAHREKLKEYNANIYYIPAKGKNLFKHWGALWKLLMTHKEYEQVYFNILDAGAVFTMLIPWLAKRKIIVHSHNGSTDKKLLHYVCRPILRQLSNRFAACSGVAAEFMFGRHWCNKHEVCIIPNAIAVDKFIYDPNKRNKIRKELGIEQELVVIHVGRLTKQKNPMRVIDIFEEVLNRNPSAILLSVGTGDAEKEVKQYAEAKNIGNAVRFLGVRNDICDLLQAADVFLLPSLYEGLPIVGIEAQASGLWCMMADTISTEVDVTGHVMFISLSEPDSVWADKIVNARPLNRMSDVIRQKLQDAGFDLYNTERKKKALAKLFLSNRVEE